PEQTTATRRLSHRHTHLAVNRPGMSGDSSSWKGWGHVRWFIEEVPAGAA
ncbi:type III-A CRISPR-associated protein Csm6, partial [Mycobacterium tuberculosis]|nr:type III-A CRISPR-associated protein Csm6 [Mycobacterium tuberculosis]